MTKLWQSFVGVGCLAALSLGACVPAGDDTNVAALPIIDSQLHKFRIVTVADGLQQPWSIAFLPGGDMLITEKSGRLRIVRDGALQPEPIAGLPKVYYNQQGGLFDVVLHPNFKNNQLLYLSFAKPNEDESESTTAVVRGRFDGAQLTDIEEIFVANSWSEVPAHYGAKLAFGHDGHLFITVGDRAVNPLSMPRNEHPAQGLLTHHGKIIRINDDGSVPEDNPFTGRGDALPDIWSYGHRNQQGLTVHPETGDLWSTEHGPQGGDELNLIHPGANYGWPVIGYSVNYGGERFHEDTHREGMEQPVQFWTPSIAISGLMVYAGERFSEWNGHFFVGGLAAKQIARLPIFVGEDGYQVGGMERPPLLTGYARFRDIRQGPDGLIYMATDDRSGGLTPVLRLEPVEESN